MSYEEVLGYRDESEQELTPERQREIDLKTHVWSRVFFEYEIDKESTLGELFFNDPGKNCDRKRYHSSFMLNHHPTEMVGRNRKLREEFRDLWKLIGGKHPYCFSHLGQGLSNLSRARPNMTIGSLIVEVHLDDSFIWNILAPADIKFKNKPVDIRSQFRRDMFLFEEVLNNFLLVNSYNFKKIQEA